MLESLLRGTSDTPAIGNFAENISLPGGKSDPSTPKKAPPLARKKSTATAKAQAAQNAQADNANNPADDQPEETKDADDRKEPKPKVNHYKEMGLEDTSILRRIAGVVGYALGKKSKKDTSKDNSSPKATGKGAKGSGTEKTTGKSGTAKKRGGNTAA